MKYFALSVLLLLLAGCDFSELWKSEPSDPVWVAQTFQGGHQCTSKTFKPPDSERILEVVGIAVYDTYAHPLPVCLACGCPFYAERQFALIERKDLRQAQRFGFEEAVNPIVASR